MRLRERGKAGGQLHPSDLASSHLNVGKDYRELGQFDQAAAELRSGLDVIGPVGGKPNQQYISTQRMLGSVLMLTGDYAAAEEPLRRALAASSNWIPPARCASRWYGSISAICCARQHRYADALEQLQLSRAVFAALPHPTGASRGNVLAALGETQLDAGQLEDARASAEAAVAAARQDLPAANYQLGAPLFALARVDLAQGRAAQAERLSREALQVRTPPHPASDPRVLEVQVALANALALQGREREADAIRAPVERVLRASSSPYAAELLTRLAGVGANVGRPRGAVSTR